MLSNIIIRSTAAFGGAPFCLKKCTALSSVANGKTRNPNEVVMRVGVRGGASFSNRNPPQTPGGDTRHWRFKEFPTSNSAATPFMRPALHNNVDLVTAKLTQVFNVELDKELDKQ